MANSVRKDTRISNRISEKEFFDLQKRAIRLGSPTRTLVSSVLHKNNNGGLTEK
jgi:predicted DNA binding CopG/RHH family protein